MRLKRELTWKPFFVALVLGSLSACGGATEIGESIGGDSGRGSGAVHSTEGGTLDARGTETATSAEAGRDWTPEGGRSDAFSDAQIDASAELEDSGKEEASDGSSGDDALDADGGNRVGQGDGASDGGSSDAGQTETFLMDQVLCHGVTSTATLEVTLSGSTVTVQRTPLTGYTDSCSYTGTMSATCSSVSGMYTCGAPYPGSGPWSATISGQSSGIGQMCGLGTTWSEQEEYSGPGNVDCYATWTRE